MSEMGRLRRPIRSAALGNARGVADVVSFPFWDRRNSQAFDLRQIEGEMLDQQSAQGGAVGEQAWNNSHRGVRRRACPAGLQGRGARAGRAARRGSRTECATCAHGAAPPACRTSGASCRPTRSAQNRSRDRRMSSCHFASEWHPRILHAAPDTALRWSIECSTFEVMVRSG